MEIFSIVRWKDEVAYGEYLTKRLVLERFEIRLAQL